MALYIYTGAAGVMLLYVGWWLGRHWRPAWVCLVVLLLAALLLTPAYPGEGIETMAPALVVFAFKYMTEGMQGAAHALRPLLFMGGAAVVISILMKVIFFRRRKAPRARPAQKRSAARTRQATQPRRA